MIPAHTLIWIWLAELRALMLPQAVPVLAAFALGIVFERYLVVPVRRNLAEPPAAMPRRLAERSAAK